MPVVNSHFTFFTVSNENNEIQIASFGMRCGVNEITVRAFTAPDLLLHIDYEVRIIVCVLTGSLLGPKVMGREQEMEHLTKMTDVDVDKLQESGLN